MNQSKETTVAKRVKSVLIYICSFLVTHPSTVIPIRDNFKKLYYTKPPRHITRNITGDEDYLLKMDFFGLLIYYIKAVLVSVGALFAFNGMSKMTNTVLEFLFEAYENSSNILYIIPIGLVKISTFLIWGIYIYIFVFRVFECIISIVYYYIDIRLFFFRMNYKMNYLKSTIRDTIVYIILTAMIYTDAGFIFSGIIELPNVLESTKYYEAIATIVQYLPMLSAVAFITVLLSVMPKKDTIDDYSIRNWILVVCWSSIILLYLCIFIYKYNTNILLYASTTINIVVNELSECLHKYSIMN
ncbi:uncharacterized protein NEPG_00122 [Nematocida parisii ERTm1]|uniref:uncharacterized protein n=1 Tax=Nematocida parisii (strain ERTm1 / ATCC PRA-289) TaxID=881290 RepID=UPI000264B799|nr:uncharacterized protein NEPG_00122 [Nematocida parisii ERTm1]EIJ94600.1 hypothetical protein NEPG_00122 [Nematocida parisii ERTm1]|eukprot:XP_013057956.1 hypothetical protein NEPG_00122 [Nematocida parisii ERTm1]